MGPTAGALLDQVLAAVASERGGRYERTHDLVRRLLQEYGEADLPVRLYADIPPDCPWDVVADLFAFLVWNTKDNGVQIQRWVEWVLRTAKDERSVRVALHLGVYPLFGIDELDRVLAWVSERYPALAERCREYVDAISKDGFRRRYVRMRSPKPGFNGCDG